MQMKPLYLDWKRSSLALICLSIFMAAGSSAQQNQKGERKCVASSKRTIDYRLVSSGRGLGRGVLGLRIVLAAKYFNRTDMMTLAENLREKYCREDVVGVTIFDNKRDAKVADIVVKHLSGVRKSKSIRGFYSLDRTRGLEKLSFSTKPGNPDDEVLLDLSGGV